MRTTATTLLAAAALAACEPPEASTATEAAGAEAALVESATPGDPKVFAPPGWPLELGDRITGKEYFTLDAGWDEGPKVPFRGGEYYSALGLIALHVVGGRVYSADFNSPDWTYYGHFPAEKYVGPKRDRDHELPPQFQNRIDYPEPYSGPLRMGTIGRPHTPSPRALELQAMLAAKIDSIDAGLLEMPDNEWYREHFARRDSTAKAGEGGRK